MRKYYRNLTIIEILGEIKEIYTIIIIIIHILTNLLFLLLIIQIIHGLEIMNIRIFNNITTMNIPSNFILRINY